MSDIVDRLHRGATWSGDWKHEAAGTITALRADVERLTRDLDEAYKKLLMQEAVYRTPTSSSERGQWNARLDEAEARAEAAEAERDRLRGLLWYGWKEMNAIRAMSGVPLDFHGTTQGICPGYWSQVVEAMNEALGDDAKPWPSHAARAALGETGEKG